MRVLITPIILVLGTLLLVPTSSLLAQATIVVSSTADNLTAGDGFCTLREAVRNANSNSDTTNGDCVAGVGLDTVNLAAGALYTLGLTGTGENASSTGDLDLLDAAGIIIKGASSTSKATVNANSIDRVFEVRAGDATFEDVVITGGRTPFADNFGGGIYYPYMEVNGRDLTLRRVDIVNNDARTYGEPDGYGGGLYLVYSGEQTVAQVNIEESNISSNKSSFTGGGLYLTANTREVEVHISNSTFSSNALDVSGSGGGLYLSGTPVNSALTVEISDSIISENSSLHLAGGIGLDGIKSAMVKESSITNNTSRYGGGMYLGSRGNYVIEASILSANGATERGGAVYIGDGQIFFSNVTIYGNSAPSGGGIFDGATNNHVTITNSTIVGNNNNGLRGTSVDTINNTIVHNNGGPECGRGTFNGTNNLIDDSSCGSTICVGGTCGTAVTNIAAGVANNGGQTQTLALSMGSNAIDAGDNTTCLLLDQRGFNRPTGGGCDIGAYEFDAVLPVELTTFEAIQNGDTILLSWATASEANNAGFSVEHLEPHASTWREVAFVVGQGTTLLETTYQHRLTTIQPGLHQFRLHQRDFDGSATYSKLTKIKIDPSSAYQLSPPFPNPTHESATISLFVREPQLIRVVLYDGLGREVRVIHDRAVTLESSLQLRVIGEGLPSGLYFIRVVGSRFAATRPITLL
ncbi:MAG: hypothetical protein RhofKO_26350 [Rhodothermales bacterium]